jgi:hypothetical protein
MFVSPTISRRIIAGKMTFCFRVSNPAIHFYAHVYFLQQRARDSSSSAFALLILGHIAIQSLFTTSCIGLPSTFLSMAHSPTLIIGHFARFESELIRLSGHGIVPYTRQILFRLLQLFCMSCNIQETICLTKNRHRENEKEEKPAAVLGIEKDSGG